MSFYESVKSDIFTIKQEASEAHSGLPFSTLDTQTVQCFANLQFQLRSVGKVYKDLSIMSSSLSADRVNQRLL